MNQDFLIGSDGNLVLVNGDLMLTLDSETVAQATAQRLQTRLRMFMGEWFLNTNLGVPYLQSILGKKGAQDIADAAIKNTALGVPNIAGINEYTSSVSPARSYSAAIVAQTADGTEATATV